MKQATEKARSPLNSNDGTSAFTRVDSGLDGVVVADTSIGGVRGSEGFFHYGPHNAAVLAETRTFEEVWHLFVERQIPTAAQAAAFRTRASQHRQVPDSVLGLIDVLAGAPMQPMNGARAALSMLGDQLGVTSWLDDPVPTPERSVQLAAAFPTIVAALWRSSQGLEVVDPDPSLGMAADYLRMVTGRTPSADAVAALERYLILTIDHGFNASTFTARVITSTGGDLCSAAVGALGALAGPLHGGAPSRVLDMFDQISDLSDAPRWIERALASGEVIMGFGHRIYRADDPRAALLRRTAAEMGGRYADLALGMEPMILEALDRHRPGRDLRTNVEYYASVVLDGVGLPRQLFTPTFAVSRLIGWLAHACEQAATNRIIRPQSAYVGQTPA
ncbi:MAG: hypothetical protein KDB16_01900 [Acidimicrobiales bacterium]|nr:hypothetical protein [Acidimicrobiales bacterium]